MRTGDYVLVVGSSHHRVGQTGQVLDPCPPVTRNSSPIDLFPVRFALTIGFFYPKELRVISEEEFLVREVMGS